MLLRTAHALPSVHPMCLSPIDTFALLNVGDKGAMCDLEGWFIKAQPRFCQRHVQDLYHQLEADAEYSRLRSLDRASKRCHEPNHSRSSFRADVYLLVHSRDFQVAGQRAY